MIGHKSKATPKINGADPTSRSFQSLGQSMQVEIRQGQKSPQAFHIDETAVQVAT